MPFYISHLAAPLLLDLCAVVAFVAARVFSRGPVDPYRVSASAAAWITTLIIVGVVAREQFAAALGAGTSSGLYAAAAREFWLGRGEVLPGRRPMIGTLIAFALSLFLLAFQFASAINFVPLPSGGWDALGVAVFPSIMLKGRSEERFRVAALVDPLTGLANRRAFLERAQRVFDRGGNDAGPVAFDLISAKELLEHSSPRPTFDRMMT